jgi:hypothetical protein
VSDFQDDDGQLSTAAPVVEHCDGVWGNVNSQTVQFILSLVCVFLGKQSNESI